MSPAAPCAVPVPTVVAQLRGRAADLAAALDGNVLIVSLHLSDEHATAYSLVFGPDGHVSLLGDGDPIFSRVRPQVRLQGSHEDVLRIVLGEVDAAAAVFADQLQLSVTPAELTPHYGSVMQIVREEVWTLLESGRSIE